MIFNMGEDECDLFSEKLEDIHLVSTRKTSDQLLSNQSFKELTLKRETGADDSAQCCTTSNWHQQLFEDSLPPSSEDIVLPSIAHEDDFSLDLSPDFVYFGSCQGNELPDQNISIAKPIVVNNALFTANQDSSSIPVTSNSPILVNRSRPASPNPNEANGSEKKKAKFEKTDCREVACINNIKMHFENQELAQHIDGSVRKYSTGQSAIISSPIFENLSTSSIVIPEKAGRNSKAYQNSLSKSPVLQNFMTRKLSTGSTPNNAVMASPDSTDYSIDVLQEYLTPSQRYSYHSRSVSTSPEPRDDVERKEGRRNGDGTKDKVPRHKRPSHIHAELRRRYKIQTCIDELNHMLPAPPGGSRANTGSSKKSNAALLARAAGHCLQLKADVREASHEADALRAEIEALTADINSYHQELPEDGVQQKTAVKSVSIEQMFDDYVQRRTWNNWKFYIFALLVRPFFETYSRVVSTDTVEQFVTTVVRWMQDHFTLSAFRTCTMPVFRHISTKTSFMVTPELLPQEVLNATMSSSSFRPAGEIMTSESSQSRRASLTLDSTLNIKRTDTVINNNNHSTR